MTRLGPLLSPVLVGRDDLLDLGDQVIAEAGAGRGRFLLLAGEAGIGKSRLITAVQRRAVAAGFRAAAGLVAPQDRDVPVASLLDLGRSMARMPEFEDLGRVLLDVAGETIGAGLVRRRTLVLGAVDRLLEAADPPLMLWFDDLQWTDDLSLEILTELARAGRERPLLLLGAYRSDEVTPDSILRPWRSRLLAQRLASEVRLAPLSAAETAQMTSVILGSPVADDVAGAIHARTDGVPLHIEELLGVLGDPGRIDARAILDAAVPQTLEDAIIHRVSRLSPDAQAVARAGAVIGRCFVPEVLAGIMDQPPIALEAPLQELIDHQVLGPPGRRGLYDFRHQLLRDALYRTVPPTDLRRFHARAAEFGRELEGASEVHASLHFERAGMRPEAFRSALVGARAASAMAAHREAFDLFRRAIDNLPEDLPAAERGRILYEAAIEAAAREHVDEWRRWAGEAAELFAEVDDRLGLARVIDLQANLSGRQGEPVARRLAMVEEIQAMLDRLPDSPETRSMRAETTWVEAHYAVNSLLIDRAKAAVDAARSLLEQEPSEEVRLAVDLVEGRLAVAEGRLAEGLERLEATALTCRETGHAGVGIDAYRIATVTAVDVMEYRRAEAWAAEGIRWSDAIEQSYCAHQLCAASSVLAWADGRWDDAVAWGHQAVARRGSERGSRLGRWGLGYTALGRGELSEATAHLDSVLSFAHQAQEPSSAVAARWGLAEAALLGGDASSAIEHAEAALEDAALAGPTGLAPFAVTGPRAYLAAGRPAEAGRYLGRLGAVIGGIPAYASPALDHGHGLVALAEGATGVARAALERAVSGWDAKGRTWEALWARLDLAAALIRSGRHADAGLLLVDVRDRAQRLGSRPLLERADALARQVRGHAVVDEPWHPLSTRELEVARLIASGMTNGKIAAELGIAPRTASSHVEHILAKLGATRRTEIATWVASLPITHAGYRS